MKIQCLDYKLPQTEIVTAEHQQECEKTMQITGLTGEREKRCNNSDYDVKNKKGKV